MRAGHVCPAVSGRVCSYSPPAWESWRRCACAQGTYALRPPAGYAHTPRQPRDSFSEIAFAGKQIRKTTVQSSSYCCFPAGGEHAQALASQARSWTSGDPSMPL